MSEHAVYTEWHHPLFGTCYISLAERVLVLAEQNPEEYVTHPEVKLLASVRKEKDVALKDPGNKRYYLGNTLGEAHNHWRRIKKGLPQRYRLFFQYASSEKKVIFAWLNDAYSLRKEGSKTDVYAVFLSMLKQGKMPDDFKTLLGKSTPIEDER